MQLVIKVFLILFLVSCSSIKFNKVKLEAPPVIIYKTIDDYSNKVPIMLSKDNSRIIAYPHPRDVFYNEGLAYPTKLDSGYLFDNMGINTNTVYIDINIDLYSKYDKVPTLSKIDSLIIGLNPFLEMHNCGNKYLLNETTELNKLIEEDFKNCKCLIKKPSKLDGF